LIIKLKNKKKSKFIVSESLYIEIIATINFLSLNIAHLVRSCYTTQRHLYIHHSHADLS